LFYISVKFVSNTEEPGLKVFEKRVLKEISGSTGEEVRGDWRKLHCEELHDLYYLSNIIRLNIRKKVRLNEHAVLMEKKRHSHRET
jgi:hypothetical protein